MQFVGDVDSVPQQKSFFRQHDINHSEVSGGGVTAAAAGSSSRVRREGIRVAANWRFY